MTRLLIIGSSHVGALKNAESLFLTGRPGIEIDFFGLRAPAFLKSRVDADGVFHPPEQDESGHELILKANGAPTVLTAAYDHVMLIGYRFGFPEVASLLQNHNILGVNPAGHDGTIDMALVEDMIDAMIDASLREVLEALAPANRSFTLCLAPYPSKGIASRAPKMELARELVAFWDHPGAAQVFEMWLSRVRSRIEAAGHVLLDQPYRTVAGPFATKPMFARAPENFDGSAMKGTDHRHMNADFGLTVLTSFARKIKNTGEAPRPAATPIKERI